MFICQKKIAGTLHARGSLAAKGIFMNSTTIDPNWDGQLTFLIYNNNDKPIELDVDSRFVTLIFHQVNTPTLSIPTTNPISVANKYGEIYGEKFNKSIVEYFSNSDNHLLKKDFDKLVREAKKPGLYDTICDNLNEILTVVNNFKNQKLSKLVAQITLIIPVSLILISLTVELY
jgi:dUTPase